MLPCTQRISLIVVAIILMAGCASKAYVLQVGKGGNAHVEAGVMQSELLSGSIVGPLSYCSVPEDAKVNQCPTMDPGQP